MEENTIDLEPIEEPKPKKHKNKKHNSLKRQCVIIGICLVFFAVLAVLYFTVLVPMLNPHSYEEFDILDGEALNIAGCSIVSSDGDGKLTVSDDSKTVICSGGSCHVKLDITDATTTSGRFYIFPAIDNDNVQEISVTNEDGTYAFYYDTSAESYYIKDYEGTPYEKSALTTLVSTARNPMSIERIKTDCDDLKSYGIDDDCAKYTITSKDGTTYTVLVGDMLVTGGGYYCALEGRNAVYALDTSCKVFYTDIESYITPLLSYPTSSTEYYNTETFTLTVDGQVLVSAGYMTEAEKEKTATNSTYQMFIPNNYIPNTSNMNHILEKFVEFEGTEVVAFGKYGETMAGVELAKYNLMNPKYEIYYRYGAVDNYVYVSKQNDDGTYYAYSKMFNIVCIVDADTLDFLSWDFIDFVDKPLFQKNINDVASLRVQTADGLDETFNITGDSGENLAVTVASTKEVMDEDTLTNFRQLYLKILDLNIEEYTDSTSTDEWLMTLTLTTDYGNVYTYSFYAYSTRRCFFTINGSGEFYCSRDRVEKIMEDTQNLLDGKEIDSGDLG